MQRAFFAFCAVACFGTPIAAAELTTNFITGGQRSPVVIDTDFVVISKTSAPSTAKAVKLSAIERAAFDQIGVEVVTRASIESDDMVIGYPIWFDKENGAVGVLTHEIVVRLQSAKELKLVRGIKGFKDVHETTFRQDLYLANFSSPMAALEAANALAGTQGVVYAHPNFILPKDWRQSAKVAAEPRAAKQGRLAGTEQIVVAVLDAGFDLNHADLNNIWRQNADEIPGNGIDDDRNGYVDDVRGWNFDNNTPDVAAGLIPQNGTDVSGLIAARHNSEGGAGVCALCSVLPLTLPFKPAADAAAFYYAESRGADIITNNWGYQPGTPLTDVVVEAINTVATRAHHGRGTVILFAMNNRDQNECAGPKPDISSLEMVVAVSAASAQDQRVSDAAWGDCMEFLAPSFADGRQGSAVATPIAAGLFGLMLSVNNELTRDEALAIVLATADKIDPVSAQYNQSGFSQKYGYGRINASKAVRAAEVFRQYTRRAADEKQRRAEAEAVKTKKQVGLR